MVEHAARTTQIPARRNLRDTGKARGCIIFIDLLYLRLRGYRARGFVQIASAGAKQTAIAAQSPALTQTFA
jgi:hypothetical protein